MILISFTLADPYQTLKDPLVPSQQLSTFSFAWETLFYAGSPTSTKILSHAVSLCWETLPNLEASRLPRLYTLTASFVFSPPRPLYGSWPCRSKFPMLTMAYKIASRFHIMPVLQSLQIWLRHTDKVISTKIFWSPGIRSKCHLCYPVPFLETMNFLVLYCTL